MQKVTVKITIESQEELAYFTQIFFLTPSQICSVSNYIPEEKMKKPEPKGFLLWRDLMKHFEGKTSFPFTFTVVLETKKELAWFTSAVNLGPRNAERAVDYVSLKKLLDDKDKLYEFYEKKYVLWRELDNLLKEA